MQPVRHITLTSLVFLVLLASGTWDAHVRAQETRGVAGPEHCRGQARSHGAADPGARLPPITELDARKATAPPRFEVKAPRAPPTW